MYDGNADKATVMLVLSGNREAYGDIVHRYKDIVFNTINAIVKNYHTAEDLTQDTFIDAYVKLKSLHEPCKIGAWLVKIAKNKCYNYFSRSALKHESELHDYIPDIRASSPENLMMEQHERQQMQQALRRLPELHKTVAILYYYDNYSHEKISELLSIPVGTVKSRLSSARSKLKKELDNMNNADNAILDKDFEKQIAEKVKTIQNYYSLHDNSYDGFEDEFKKTVELIDQLPDSKTKHTAYADVYLVASYQDKNHQDRALQEAELSENAKVIANVTINKYINGDNDALIEKVEETISKIKKMPDSDNAIGELLFWSGSKKFLKGRDNDDTVKLNEAKADFIEAEKKLNKENSYHPNAIAAIKAVEIELTGMGEYAKCSYGICGEQLIYHDNKLLFGSQPGFSGSTFNINKCDGIFFYVSYIFSRTFFDENMEIGEAHSIAGDKGSTLTLVSKNAKVYLVECKYLI